MKTIGLGAVLAASTVLVAGAAWAQQTVSFTIDASSPVSQGGQQLAVGTVTYGSGARTVNGPTFVPAGASMPVSVATNAFIYPDGTTVEDTSTFGTGSVASLAGFIHDTGSSSLGSTGQVGTFVLIIDPLANPDEGVYSFDFLGDVSFSFAGGIDALTAASGTAARLIVIGADGVARDAGQVSIATRNGQTTFTRVADGTGVGTVTASTSGMPGMMGNLYTWAEVTGFRSNTFGSGDGTLASNGLQIGADMEIGPDMVAGLSLGYTTVNSEDAGTTFEGHYTYLQPYVAYRSGAWNGTASLIYGVGNFEQDDGAGEADVTLAAVTFEGGYDYALTDRFTLTPTLGLLHGRENVDGTSGTLAGASSDVTFSQASLGARITHGGPNRALFAGIHADYLTNETESILAQDLLANDGWTGRVEVGGEMSLPNGMELSTGVELSGLGGDLQSVSGGLRFSLQF